MIILNEKIYAEDCLKGNFNKDKPLLSVSILAKYYRHVMGYSKKQIVESLMEFLSKHYPKYKANKNYWITIVEQAANNAKSRPLHEIDGVWITEAELAAIESIGSKVLERLAFTVLCIAKLNNLRNPNNNGWVKTEDKEVFALARISGTVAERSVRLGQLMNRGLLQDAKRIDNLSYRVIFINEESPGKLFINDFRELGYQYQKYKGEKFKRCKKCGILTRDNRNGTKLYCPDCAAPQLMVSKWLSCIECGESFEVSSRNNKSKRCPACQHQANLESRNNRVKRFRANCNGNKIKID